MRAIIACAFLLACVMAAGCSSAQVAGTSVRQPLDLPTAGGGPASPFAATRGSAAPPPQGVANAGQTAPPQGTGSGGIDFGQWRSADPEVYGPSFQTQMRTRFQGAEPAAARTDLERNGFACRDRERALECRIEISENQCAKEWYVVFEQARREPVAGFDVMCLGATRR
jgi:hypothetical protein